MQNSRKKRAFSVQRNLLHEQNDVVTVLKGLDVYKRQTLSDAVYLAEYLYKNHMRPEQVQDFYPTPGTVST